MAYSNDYNTNAAWRTWLQTTVADVLDKKFVTNTLDTTPNPGDDPNWIRNILSTYKINADTFDADWKSEVTAQKAAKGFS